MFSAEQLHQGSCPGYWAGLSKSISVQEVETSLGGGEEIPLWELKSGMGVKNAASVQKNQVARYVPNPGHVLKGQLPADLQTNAQNAFPNLVGQNVAFKKTQKTSRGGISHH